MDKNNGKSHFFVRMVQDSQRQSNRPLVCPRCSEDTTSFPTEGRLFEHATTLHSAAVGGSRDGLAWKNYYAEAVNKTNQKHGRTLGPPTHSPGFSKASSTDSMKLNVGGDDMKSPTLSSRPVSTSISINPGEKKIEDITNLSLTQGPASGSGPNHAHGRAQSPNPLKRGAGADSGSPDPPINPGDSRNRRAKGRSGEAFLPKDSDFERKTSTSQAPGAGRERTSNKTLFDHTADNRVFGSGPRRGGHGEAITAARQAQASRLHVASSKKDAIEVKNIDTKLSNRLQQPGIIDKAQFNLNSPLSEDANLHSPLVDDPEQDTNVEDAVPELLFQPETRPISHEQLVTEVKGIYAGLVMVEAKCIDVDEKQSKAAQEKDPSKQTRLTAEQWQALIALHKTLLHEHHDFFLASQHPSASPALSKLAAKYSMPARMWRHGIHAFLEVLRHRLPDSLDHMLAFIYIAYSMMALLYETVPAFEDTWIECLGDLGRYRMAIEDDDLRDREVWSGVARFWYGKAADKRPTTGRLYHHLAILARPYTLQQLSLYTQSLTCIIPFESARGSIMTLFNPVLEKRESSHHKPSAMETAFVTAHGLLFTQESQNPQTSHASLEGFVDCVEQLRRDLLGSFITKPNSRFKEQGVFAALANVSALLEYGVLDEQGRSRSILRLAIEQDRTSKDLTASTGDSAKFDTPSTLPTTSVSMLDLESSRAYKLSLRNILHAADIAFWTLDVALGYVGNRNVFPLVHVYLVFLLRIINIEKAMRILEMDIPWKKLADFLSPIAKPETMTPKVRNQSFPRPSEGIGRPLPEDFVMRGQLYSESYFPDTWFSDAAIDDEERALELPSMAAPRLERILWLGHRIAAVNRWLTYDHATKTFSVTREVKGFNEREIKQPIPFPALDDNDSSMVDADTVPLQCVSDIKSSVSEVQAELRPPPTTQKKAYKVVPKPGKDPPATQPTKILSREDVDMPDAKPVKREDLSSPPIKKENPDSEEWLKGEYQTKATGPQKMNPDSFASDQRKLDTMMIDDSLSPINNKA